MCFLVAGHQASRYHTAVPRLVKVIAWPPTVGLADNRQNKIWLAIGEPVSRHDDDSVGLVKFEKRYSFGYELTADKMRIKQIQDKTPLCPRAVRPRAQCRHTIAPRPFAPRQLQ